MKNVTTAAATPAATTAKGAKPAAVDLATLKLTKAAATLSGKVGKALDQQAQGAKALLESIVNAPKGVTRDQLKAAVYQAYVARGNAEGTAKIRASEAAKVWDARSDVAPLVESGDIGGLQAASKAAGNIAKGKPWNEKAPSRQSGATGPKTPSAPKQDASSVPASVTKAIAEQSLRDHVNRLKANAKDQAAAEWLSKVVDVINMIG